MYIYYNIYQYLCELHTGPHHPSIVYPDPGVTYRPQSQLIINTRYGSNHAQYLGSAAISTTASNSLQHLTHLPSHSSPFQFLPQTTHHSSTFQQRHPTVTAYPGQVLSSTLQVTTSPAIGATAYITGQPQQQQPRLSTANCNVGYSNTIASTASQHPLHHSADSEQLPSQTVFTLHENSGFSSPQLSQHQQSQHQQNPQQQQQQWSSSGFQ